MTTKNIVFENESKLQRENLVGFIQAANEFFSSISIQSNAYRVNAKSLLGLMALEFRKGTEIVLRAEGDDEEQAVHALAAYLT